MPEVTRRSMIAATLLTAAAVSEADGAQPAQNDATAKTEEPTKDQQFVMAAGMTREEADCWKKLAEAAGAFFQLPELHPMDKQEVASAIHLVQNKLLGRPTYRKYLELAKESASREN